MGQDINPHTMEPFYDKYSPVNKLVKKNRIRYIVDSSRFITPGNFDIEIYDTLGRLIGKTYRPIDSFDNPYIYRIAGDTTFRLKYNKDRTKLNCFERFVLNKKEQIVSYLDCCNYYFEKDNYYVGYEEFFYDEKDRLKTWLRFFKQDYPGEISDKNIINPIDLQLNEVIYFTYQTMRNGNKLVIGKHALGNPEWRETDSTIYDKQNRIIHFNSFAKRGAIGEMVHDNLNRITKYVYKGDSLTITNYATYCQAFAPEIGCLLLEQTDKHITLIIYNRDMTKKAEYGFYFNGEKYLKDKYEYGYY